MGWRSGDERESKRGEGKPPNPPNPHTTKPPNPPEPPYAVYTDPPPERVITVSVAR